VDAQVINAYLRGLVSVLSPLGMEIQRQDLQLEKSPYTDETALIISQLSGAAQGDIIIGMPEDTVTKLLESFNIPADMVDESMKQSVLTEFGDMVKGHAITGYQSLGLPVDFTKVALFDSVYPEPAAAPGVQSLCVTVLANEQYPLRIHFALQ